MLCFSTTPCRRCQPDPDIGFGITTLREPPNSRQATASLIFSPPKICGAMRLKMLATASGRAANSLNSASSSCLRACRCC